MAWKVILNTAAQQAQKVDAARIDGFDLTDCTVIDVDDDFDWLHTRPDWTATPPLLVDNIEAMKAQRHAEVVQALVDKKMAGFSVTAGPAAGAVFQIRDANDTANWLVLARAVDRAIANGDGAVVAVPYRDADDNIIWVSNDDAKIVLDAMADYGLALLQASWGLKDAIDAAADATELAAIDINAGWPG